MLWALMTIVVAVVCLVGWITNNLILASVNPAFIMMAPSTGISFCMLGAALLGSLCWQMDRPWQRALFRSLVWLSVLLSALVLVAFFSGTESMYERVLSRTQGRLGTIPIGRMSSVTAVMFLLSCAGLLLGNLSAERGIPLLYDAATAMGLSLILAGFALAVGYSYGMPLFYGDGFVPPALPTVICFLTLALGIVYLSGPYSRVMGALFKDSVYARLVRGLVPPVLIVVFLDGLADTKGSIHIIENFALSHAVFTLFIMAIIMVVVLHHSRKISHQISEAESDRDKSEARETELRGKLERAARMESLGVLAGGVAHDLNNILGPMLIVPDLVRDYVEAHADSTDPEYADTVESLEIMKESAQRAASVVSDLVAMGRRGQFEKVPVNVNRIVDQFLELKQVKMIQDARPDVHILKRQGDDPVWCMGDESRLLRVLANLVGNAVEAIEGQGEVIISTGRQVVADPILGFDVVPAGDYITIEVTDSGCGMDAKTMLRSFEPFFSMKAPGERSGSGLGLSVVHGLVKDHEGFLDLKSTAGKGSTFTIYLPAAEAGATSEESKRVPLPKGNERILVVDDEACQQDSARLLLKKLGYSTIVVSSGEEAVALFESARRADKPAPFDLVLMDMIMRGMDGMATSKEIRRLYAGQKVLIVSGHAPDNLDREAEALGISWITKPYTAYEMACALRANL